MSFTGKLLIGRLVLGVLLMIGGTLFFLPVLGLWMFPLGVLLIATCIPYFDRKIRGWTRVLGKVMQEPE